MNGSDISMDMFNQCNIFLATNYAINDPTLASTCHLSVPVLDIPDGLIVTTVG